MKFNHYFLINDKDHRVTGGAFADFSYHHLDGWSVDGFEIFDAQILEEGSDRPIIFINSLKDLEQFMSKADYEEFEQSLIDKLMEEAIERAEDLKNEHSHSEE